MSYYQVIYISELIDLLDQHLQIDEVVKFHKTFNISFSINFMNRIYNDYTKGFILCTKRNPECHLGNFRCSACQLIYCGACSDKQHHYCKYCGNTFCKKCFQSKQCNFCAIYICNSCQHTEKCDMNSTSRCMGSSSYYSLCRNCKIIMCQNCKIKGCVTCFNAHKCLK